MWRKLMTRDFRMYKEYPHFDMNCDCNYGCNHYPNFCPPSCPPIFNPTCPPNCNQYPPPKCPPKNYCCDDFMWLMVGISIGRMLDK